MKTDAAMGWECFWNGHGMLTLTQNQALSPLRDGAKTASLYFEAQELPALLADLRRAAEEGAENADTEGRVQADLAGELRAAALLDFEHCHTARQKKSRGAGA